MTALLAMVPPFALGWMVVRFLMPARRGFYAWMLDIALGIALGAGIASILEFVLTCAGVANRVTLLSAEVLALAGAGLVEFRRRPLVSVKPVPEKSAQKTASWIWLLRLAAVVGLALFTLDFSAAINSSPAGEWDAAGIWNLRARYLAGGPETWRNAFSHQMAGGMIGASHPGYPLLVSGFIARTWTILGTLHAPAPAVLSFIFAIGTLAVLAGALAETSEVFALTAVLVLLATETFVSQAAAQYSDIPLSCFVLGATATVALAASRDWPPGLLALAGLLAGLAAWTKNEGLPFALAAAAVVIWRARLRAIWMIAGAAGPILATLALKLFLVQGSEAMFPKTVGQALTLIGEGSRWSKIIASFAQNFRDLGVIWAHPLLLLAILWFAFGLVPAKERRWWLLAAPLGLLAADFGIYLITTADLDWHLGTSNNRLIVQVWPALLFGYFALLRAPAAPVTHTQAGKKPASRKKG